MKIQILGPETRNRVVIEFLRTEHEVFLTEDEVDLADLQSKGVEYVVSNGYAPILQPPVIENFRNKIVNIHPAYLPHGRGIYPNFWCIFEGFPRGATIHYIDEGIDTGAIILREEVSFHKTETLRTANEALVRLAENLFIMNAKNILSGNIAVVQQVERDNKRFYHNRHQSEYFIELLPNGWDTSIDYVERMGRDFLLSVDCINHIKEQSISQNE